MAVKRAAEQVSSGTALELARCVPGDLVEVLEPLNVGGTQAAELLAKGTRLVVTGVAGDPIDAVYLRLGGSTGPGPFIVSAKPRVRLIQASKNRLGYEPAGGLADDDPLRGRNRTL